MKLIKLVFKGIAIGIAHMVPGVSGGTFMVLMGIYKQFVEAVGNFFTNREMTKDYILLLLPLGIGVVCGVLAFAHLATIVLDRYPVPTQFFFIGLIVGSIPGVVKIHHDMKPSVSRVVAFFLGLGLVVFLGVIKLRGYSFNFSVGTTSLPVLLLFAVISFLGGGAMVTPGMDGSYVLLLGGIYGPIMEALASLTSPPVRWGVIISVAIGAGIGILICSRLIDQALKRQPAVTFYAILGLICGSFVGLWPADLHLSVSSLAGVLTFTIGAVITYLLSKPSISSQQSDQ